MREEIKLFISKMNRDTSLDEMQKVCKTEQELCFVLSSLDDMKEREKAVLLPATLRRRAMLTFQNVSIEEITVQDVQVKLLIGYSKALAVKKWLEKRYGNKN